MIPRYKSMISRPNTLKEIINQQLTTFLKQGIKQGIKQQQTNVVVNKYIFY
jgi:hypothetical protein